MTANLVLAVVLLAAGTTMLVLTVRGATRGLADLRQLRVKVAAVLDALDRRQR